MKKLLGLALFLLVIYLLLLLSDPGAQSAYNHFNLGRRIGLYGIISLGAGILIITGGIDLSIGSVIGLCATVFATLLVEHRWNPLAAIAAVLALGACIGTANGLLATKLRVQAFVVTLCGLFIYRGAARWLAGDQVKGLGTKFESLKYWLSDSKDVLGLPMSLVIFCLLAAVATVFLHLSVYGRYLFAVGSNDQAARYSGIAVDRYRILAYVICSSLAALFSILFLLEAEFRAAEQHRQLFRAVCHRRRGAGRVQPARRRRKRARRDHRHRHPVDSAELHQDVGRAVAARIHGDWRGAIDRGPPRRGAAAPRTFARDAVSRRGALFAAVFVERHAADRRPQWHSLAGRFTRRVT